MSIFANKESNVRNTSHPPGWVFGGSSLSQDDVAILEGVGVLLGDERIVRPTEEPRVSDWPVEDGTGQGIRAVQRRVLPFLLTREKARVQIMLIDGRDKYYPTYEHDHVCEFFKGKNP